MTWLDALFTVCHSSWPHHDVLCFFLAGCNYDAICHPSFSIQWWGNWGKLWRPNESSHDDIVITIVRSLMRWLSLLSVIVCTNKQCIECKKQSFVTLLAFSEEGQSVSCHGVICDLWFALSCPTFFCSLNIQLSNIYPNFLFVCLWWRAWIEKWSGKMLIQFEYKFDEYWFYVWPQAARGEI